MDDLTGAADASRLAWGSLGPAIQWAQEVMRPGRETDYPPQCRLGMKRPVREANHSPPSAKVKNEWSYISTPPLRFIDCTRIHFSLNVEKNIKMVWLLMR